jgi:hypothetical protein
MTGVAKVGLLQSFGGLVILPGPSESVPYGDRQLLFWRIQKDFMVRFIKDLTVTPLRLLLCFTMTSTPSLGRPDVCGARVLRVGLTTAGAARA